MCDCGKEGCKEGVYNIRLLHDWSRNKLVNSGWRAVNIWSRLKGRLGQEDSVLISSMELTMSEMEVALKAFNLDIPCDEMFKFREER